MTRLCTAALLILVFLSWFGCSGDGEGDTALPGFGIDEMSTPEAREARKVLGRFLEGLAFGDFNDAAAQFSGDLRVLRDLNEDVAPDDVAELLSRLCAYHGGACLPARVVSGSKEAPGRYVFEVEFLEPDGTLFQTGDTLIAESLRTTFAFRVERIGTRFFVLDLPPRSLPF